MSKNDDDWIKKCMEISVYGRRPMEDQGHG